jgi:acetyltransferase-like isoleucine patch superfamily enzyme
VPRTLPGDWFPGSIPDNVLIEGQALLETSFSLQRFRSQAAIGLRMADGSSAYTGTMFDVGPQGAVDVGRCVMLNSVWVMCDESIVIGDYTLVSWNVVLMDSYREPLDPAARRRYREEMAAGRTPSVADRSTARRIVIGRNVWIGFESCILPGVTLGEGTVVGARSVVTESAPPFSMLAGNPARVIRRLEPQEIPHASV